LCGLLGLGACGVPFTLQDLHPGPQAIGARLRLIGAGSEPIDLHRQPVPFGLESSDLAGLGCGRCQLAPQGFQAVAQRVSSGALPFPPRFGTVGSLALLFRSPFSRVGASPFVCNSLI